MAVEIEHFAWFVVVFDDVKMCNRNAVELGRMNGMGEGRDQTRRWAATAGITYLGGVGGVGRQRKKRNVMRLRLVCVTASRQRRV
jgi:hypothetical protein